VPWRFMRHFIRSHLAQFFINNREQLFDLHKLCVVGFFCGARPRVHAR
jgi:hypothetical protein